MLGSGSAFWTQITSITGNIGGKSFIASARRKGEIEQVNPHHFLYSIVMLINLVSGFSYKRGALPSDFLGL